MASPTTPAPTPTESRDDRLTPDVAAGLEDGNQAESDRLSRADGASRLGTGQLGPYALNTYRYLRLSIVVVVSSVMAAVLIERAHAGCWQGSISSYYYTPAHAIFIGALVTIGVSLIAIKGCTDLEDVLLNVAGVLAPIVAFVPTSPSSDACPSTAFVGGDPKAYIDNNVLAFAVGGGIAIVIACVIARAMHKPRLRDADRPLAVALVAAVFLWVVGLVWYLAFQDNFLDHAHGGGAVVMFAIIGVVMVINARSARRGYRVLYALTAAAMVAGVAVAIIGKAIDGDWRHQILWLETLELVPFGIYWTAQTFEHWDGGVPTGADRQQRAADSRLLRQ